MVIVEFVYCIRLCAEKTEPIKNIVRIDLSGTVRYVCMKRTHTTASDGGIGRISSAAKAAAVLVQR